jgi:hypothetical protein
MCHPHELRSADPATDLRISAYVPPVEIPSLNRRWLTAATVLIGVGVLLVLIGSLINGDWPSVHSEDPRHPQLVALAILWRCQRDRR